MNYQQADFWDGVYTSSRIFHEFSQSINFDVSKKTVLPTELFTFFDSSIGWSNPKFIYFFVFVINAISKN